MSDASDAQTQDPPAEPDMLRRALARVAAALLVGFGVIPALLFWCFVGRAPTVTVQEARAMLGRPGQEAALVNVRPAELYAQGHAERSVHWPLDAVLQAGRLEDVPESLRGKVLLVLCETGIASARGVLALRKLGIEAWNVDGGTATWLASADPSSVAEGDVSRTRFREAPAFEQVVATASGFTIKPAYMVLSLVIAWLLRRRRELDLTAMRWAMFVFFAGESFCYLNYFAFRDQSHLVEYLHSYGMAAGAAFGIFATFEGLDRRLFHYSAPREKCAALALCGPCVKYTDAACGFRRLFQLLIPLALVLACLPLAARPHAVSYDTQIFAVRYNYSHPLVCQIYEMWVCPLLSLGLLAAAWLVLVLKRDEPVAWSKLYFSAGLGLLSFGLLRFFIFAPFRDDLVWFQLWEELTELLGILAALAVLWIFRRGLLGPKASATK